MVRIWFVIFLCIVFAIGFVSPSIAQTWVEHSFEDFIDGKLDASGNNIYISRDGKIRTIHRFDYNDDGYIDLLFCNTHDQVDNLPATLAEVLPNKNIKESELAFEGSLQVGSDDLNLDGYQDLIFSPNHDGIQDPRNFITIIYGGEDGWPGYRATGHLPVNGSNIVVAIADLNQDNWPDIVTLNDEAWSVGQPSGNIIRIYWGGERGYLNTRFHDIGIPNATSLTSGDLDENGYKDIAVLGRDSTITILWSTQFKKVEPAIETSSLYFPPGSYSRTIASGDLNENDKTDLVIGTSLDLLYIIPSSGNRSWRDIQEVNAFKASNIAIGNIDSDGQKDIVLSYFKQSIGPAGEYGGADEESSGRAAHVLWGSKEEFSGNNSISLEALNISGATIGDFDGDGNNDIAIAINKDDQDFTTQSVIYYNRGNREFDKGKDGITTSGALYVHTVPKKNGKKDLVIFCNSKAGSDGEIVPSFVYWGNSEGFSEEHRTEIFMRSGYEATVADLNANGYTDMVIMGSMHHGQADDPSDDPWAGANIFWGSPEGIDFSKEGRTILSEPFVASSNVADLNKDGYLDLVLGSFDMKGHETSVIIYYGGEEGFNRNNRVEIPCPGRSLSIQLADYNKNGWLDIAVASYSESVVRIFYGNEEGFDFHQRAEVDVPRPIDLNTADLNDDGWLDIIACSYNDIANNDHHDMGTYIFWGSHDGFNQANSQWLPGFTGLGPVIADFDDDDYLDIFIPHYHGEHVRSNIPAYLYWGSEEGYKRSNRTELINNSGAQGFAADFNKDGKLDLAVANHTARGNHNTNSKIFYNNGSRFENARVEEIPTKGPHWSHNEDMGHIYDRYWKQTYESSIFEWNKKRTHGHLSYLADIPDDTNLLFDVRSAANKSELATKEWRRVNGGNFIVNGRDRFLQYRAVFSSGNGDRFPVLDKVILELVE